jgi:hypothetical protein
MRSLKETSRWTKACAPIAAGLEVTPPVTMKAIAVPGAIPFFDQAGY